MGQIDGAEVGHNVKGERGSRRRTGRSNHGSEVQMKFGVIKLTAQ